MTVAAFLVDTEIRFGPDTWLTGPCPGSELAVLHTASALAGSGWEVHVACPTDRTGLHGGVFYHGLPEITALAAEAEVAVHVRSCWRAPPPKRGARTDILWLQDTVGEMLSLAPGRSAADLGASLSRHDALVFASDWHRRHVGAGCGQSLARLPMAGFHQPLPPVPLPEATDRGLRLIHTAHPRKALPVVLAAFARMLDDEPEAELVLCGHPAIYQQDHVAVAGRPMTVEDFLAPLAPAVRERIRLLPGSLPQRGVLDLLGSATLLLHPDLSVETGATTVLEAMACGTVPIVSDKGCLPELCWNRGAVVAAGLPDFADEVAAAALMLLRDPLRRERLAARARAFTAPLRDPDAVARRWTGLVDEVRRKSTARPRTAPLRRPERFRAVEAETLDRNAWEAFCRDTPEAWFTHMPDWHRHAEKRFEEGGARWLAILDEDGRPAALAPLSCPPGSPGTVVSGLVEPSGPCLPVGGCPERFRRLAFFMLEALLERAGPGRRLVLKLPALSGDGPSDLTTALRSPLREAGFSLGIGEAYCLPAGGDPAGSLSRRFREQVRAAARTCRVARATRPEDLALAHTLHAAHAEADGLPALDHGAFAALAGGPDPMAIVLLGHVGDTPDGYAVCFRHRRAAALHAWGVGEAGKATGLAKLLVVEALRHCLDAGAGIVEYGGALDRDPRTGGVAEFYRRFGGIRVPHLLASAGPPARPAAPRYAVT